MIPPKKYLAEITPYKLPITSRKNKIRLDLNENIRGCSPKVIEALRNISANDISIYPEYNSLIKKIANYYKVNVENILLTNGTDDAIRCIMDTYIGRGDEVIIPTPTFPMFEILAKLKGAKIVKILYNKDFSFPLMQLLNTITEKTRMVIIVNPNSPLGTSVEKDVIIKILTAAKDSIIFLDETYSHFAKRTYIELIKEFKNLIVAETFSKVFGLAGLRLGFIASYEKNIENLSKVNLPFSVNSLAVIAGSVALDDRKYIKKVIEENEVEKKFLYEELKKLGIEAHMTDTNFLLVNFAPWSDRIYRKLVDRGILVKNLKGTPLLDGYLRITIPTRKENLILLSAIQEIVPPEAILFDMDGVLVDVSASYRIAIKKTAEYFLKKYIPMKEIEKYKTKSGYNNEWDVTEAIILSHSVKARRVHRNEIINKFQHFYLGNNFDGLIKNEKWLLSIKILNRLHKVYRLGIITGRPEMETEYTLRKFGVKKYFEIVVAMDNLPQNKQKPDPYGIKLALKKLNVKRAFYVGDNIDDIKAAISAGVVPIGIISPYINRKKMAALFKRLGAKYILRNVNDIQEVLE